MPESSGLGLGLSVLTSVLSATVPIIPGIQKDWTDGYNLPPAMVQKLSNAVRA
jgi:hypothetical protein